MCSLAAVLWIRVTIVESLGYMRIAELSAFSEVAWLNLLGCRLPIEAQPMRRQYRQ